MNAGHCCNWIGKARLKAAEQTAADIGGDPAMRQQYAYLSPIGSYLHNFYLHKPERRIPIYTLLIGQKTAIPDQTSQVHSQAVKLNPKT